MTNRVNKTPCLTPRSQALYCTSSPLSLSLSTVLSYKRQKMPKNKLKKEEKKCNQALGKPMVIIVTVVTKVWYATLSALCVFIIVTHVVQVQKSFQT